MNDKIPIKYLSRTNDVIEREGGGEGMKLEKRKRIRSESFEKKKKKNGIELLLVSIFKLRVETGETGGKGDRETSRRGSLH